MEAISIGTRREVCWDEYLIDTCENVRVQMHEPQFRNVVMKLDRPWEGCCSTYFTIIPEGLMNRVYYRGAQFKKYDPVGGHDSVMCYAESFDGKSFLRKNLGIVPFKGTDDNNIIIAENRDNISFFRDDNPECKPEERYKGLAGFGQALWLYVSADGVHFQRTRIVCDDGAYDSLNVAFWDHNTKQYFLYYRGVHGGEVVNDGKWNEGIAKPLGNELHNHLIRDVRVRTSKDFVNWGEPQRITFDPERDDIELYTNQIKPYYRADHMFLGFPTRYTDRFHDKESVKCMPAKEFRSKKIEVFGREGTVATDALIMTSRDGYSFRRTEESFMTPGPENGRNWFYGEGYVHYGMIETEAEYPGEPNEISLYMGKNYQVSSIDLCRYAIRLDGFFSWRADYQGGKIITKPVIFDGGKFSINFKASGGTYIRIRFLDEDGNFIDGYDSGNHYGDSVEREIKFEKPVSELSGKPVRIEVSLKDADLYSFKFDTEDFTEGFEDFGYVKG